MTDVLPDILQPGLTDICKVRHGSDEEVGTVEFDVAGLEQKIAAAEPANLAFNGKNAARGNIEPWQELGQNWRT